VHEDKKRGLESVFDIVVIAEDTAANAEHHGPVASHEGFKRRLIPATDEPLHEASVLEIGPSGLERDFAEMLYHGIRTANRHGGVP
jgi:hypothetical protein